MAGGTLLTTATLVFIRLLGRDLPTAEILFLRYVFALLAIAPWILRVGVGNTFATRRLGLYGFRGVVATISTAAWYYGITVVPLAEALALNCLAAIFVTIGAVVFLGEKADARRWMAVLTGLFGAWIILRPGFQVVSTGSIIIACSAVGWAATMLLMKVLARTDSPLTIVVYLYVFNVRCTLSAIAELEASLGQSVGFHRTGTMRVAEIGETSESLENMIGLLSSTGIEARTVDGESAREMVPWLDSASAHSIIHVAEDGYVEGHMLASAYMRAARNAGATLWTQTSALAAVRSGERIVGVETTRGRIGCKWLVDAAGTWARQEPTRCSLIP